SYIATGGMIPQGADSVIKIEDVLVDSAKNEIVITSPIPKGWHVRFRGGDMKSGDIVLQNGTLLTPFAVGALANLGQMAVNVVQKPRVAILTSGDELVMPFEDPKPWQIRDSNSLTISSQVSELGGVPMILGITKDNVEQAVRKIKFACDVANVVVTCGGVSVGEMDPFIAAFQEMNAEKRVHGVAIKPGKPFFFGLIKGKPIFGLPGNQASSAITFELFVRPFLKRMLRCQNPDRRIIYLPLNQPSFNSSDRDLFKQAKFFTKEQNTFAYILEKQESHLRTSLLEMDILVRHPRGISELAPDQMVECRLLNS
ncbi:molybdopterin molybdotransferase MoeA, partial [bacterium]|nr:molybdopterin molybdotransferase MoeA [bacterium]